TDLEEIDADEHGPKFHHVSDLAATTSFENPIFSHTEKLNALAATIAGEAAADDVLLFLDGDAFPIAPLGPFPAAKLARYRAAARPAAGRAPPRAPHLAAPRPQVALGRQAPGRQAGTEDVAPKQGALRQDLRGAPGRPLVLAPRLTGSKRHTATVQAMSAAAT